MRLNMVSVPPAGHVRVFTEASSWARNYEFIHAKNYNYYFAKLLFFRKFSAI